MNQLDKYGFVYIWRDKRRQMYYIGCHWGTTEDGYICSSRRMRKAYRRRPKDFRRKILQYVYTNRIDLLEKEHNWLQLISDKELKVKLLNLEIQRNAQEKFLKPRKRNLKNIDNIMMEMPSQKSGAKTTGIHKKEKNFQKNIKQTYLKEL